MSRITVVIADDSEIMRASLRQLLAEDFDVIGEVADGAAVVEVCEKLAPDAIIMDISMPGVSGIEAARRLRERGCVSAIVFLSVHRQRRIVQDALSTSNSGYVAKSDARRELTDAVRAVAGGASFRSQSLAH
jgi:DNA-binding NarL/FixJ family response regulator